MENNSLIQRQYKIMGNLCHLPKKILTFHDNNVIAPLVLHELCGPECFNLKKAAYFVDNPDFDCMRGVAGFCRQNSENCVNGWCNPDQFESSLSNDSFNLQVKNLQMPSLKRSPKKDLEVAQELAHNLGMMNPNIHYWDMKNDNHGLFICEKVDQSDNTIDELMPNAVCLLSFCPVF